MKRRAAGRKRKRAGGGRLAKHCWLLCLLATLVGAASGQGDFGLGGSDLQATQLRYRRWQQQQQLEEPAAPSTRLLAVSGRPVELRCPLASELQALAPGHTIGWRKNGVRLSQLEPRLKLNAANGSLLIVGAQWRLDEALYECELEPPPPQQQQQQQQVNQNATSSWKRHRFHLKLVVPPRLAPFEFPQDAQVGMRLVLTCSVLEGQQPLSFVWLKDEQLIRPHQVGVASANSLGQLHQQQLAEKRAAGEAGEAGADYALLGADQLEPSEEKEHLLPSLADSNIRVRQADDYSILALDKLELKHSGRYTCSVANEAARVSHSSTLTINAPASLTLEPHDLELVSGHSGAFHCAASGQPRPSISWLRARESANKLWDYVPVYDNLRYSTLANGSLALANVTQRDQGYYLCSAKNAFGPEASKLVRLSVHEPAKFSAKYNTLEVRVDERANMICSASGELPLAIEWLDKEAKPIQRDDKRFIIDHEPLDVKSEPNQTLSRLILTRATNQDSGHYTCLASNKHGADKMVTNLLVQDVPDKVSELKVTNTTASTISIRWQLAFTGNAPVTSYLVQYQSDEPLDELLPLSAATGSNEGQQELRANLEALAADEEAATDRTLVELTVEQASSQSLVVRELAPFCLYRLRLAAINKLGLGDFSDWLRARTEEAPPGGPPLKVAAVATGPNSIKLQWSPPERRAWNGQLLGFTISYRLLAEPAAPELNKTLEWAAPTLQTLLASSSKLANESLPAANATSSKQALRQHLRQLMLLQRQELVAHLTNLQRSASYLVWVAAVNGRGVGPQSAPMAVKTLDDVPPSAPALKLQSSGPSSITIGWALPSNFVSPANQYSLFYRRSNPPTRNTSAAAAAAELGQAGGGLLLLASQPQPPDPSGPFIERTLASQQLMVGGPGAGQYQQFVYTLDQLECGSAYELYMITRNTVGKSEPSALLSGRTLGEPPAPPTSRSNLFARIGVHEVALNLLAWQTGGCPIQQLQLRYRPADLNLTAGWPITTSVPVGLLAALNGHLLAGPQPKQPELAPPTFTLRSLLPSTAYELEMVAGNSAGLTAAHYEFMTASLNGSRSGYSRREGVFRLDQRGQPVEQQPAHGGPHILEQQAPPASQTPAGAAHHWLPLLLLLLCFVCLLVSSTFCYFRLLDTWKGGPPDPTRRRPSRRCPAGSHQSDSPPSSLEADKAAMWQQQQPAKEFELSLAGAEQEPVHYCMREPSTNHLLSATLKNPSAFSQSLSMKEFGPAAGQHLEASTLRNPRLVYATSRQQPNDQLHQNYASTLAHHTHMCSIYAACKQKHQDDPYAAHRLYFPPDQSYPSEQQQQQQQETSWTNYGLAKPANATTAYAIPSQPAPLYSDQQTYGDYRQDLYDQLQAGGHLLLEQSAQLQQQQQQQQQHAMVQQKDRYNQAEPAQASQQQQQATNRLNCAGQSVVESSSSGSSSGIDVASCPVDYSSSLAGSSTTNNGYLMQEPAGQHRAPAAPKQLA